MKGLGSWMRVAWPLLVLLLFGAGLRRAPPRADPSDARAECETGPASGIDVLERCLLLQPDDVELMTDLGAAYERLGHRDQAEAIYRRALVIEPHGGNLHIRLGALLRRRGDDLAARREGKAALTVQPNNPKALDLIGRPTADQGQGR